MRNEFTGLVERDGPWHIAYCPEIPGANGQGKTKAAALKSLSRAIALILEDRRKDGLRGVPATARREKVASGEAGRPASAPQEARLPPKARRALALAADPILQREPSRRFRATPKSQTSSLARSATVYRSPRSGSEPGR